MPYNIQFRRRATKEYLNAIWWYNDKSEKAALNFVSMVEKTLDAIEKQPNLFRVVYKNFHQAKTKKYPFNIVYFVDEKNESIIITTIYHEKRNPSNKFK